MNLPFTPSFFKQIDIYQKLREFEARISTKPIWEVEKLILLWADSKDHQHIASYISPSNIQQYLHEAINTRKVSLEAVDSVVSPQHALNALVTRGFAEKHPVNESVRINSEGFIAGKILRETQNLTDTWKYKFWQALWWLIFMAAVLLLLSQTIGSIFQLLDRFEILFVSRIRLLSHPENSSNGSSRNSNKCASGNP